MKKIIFTAVSLSLIFAVYSVPASAQDNNEPQNKSYVKIKTMKIVNGDTIVTEKEYKGNGNMSIDDTLTGQGFGNFQFRTFNNPDDSSFFQKYSHMGDMFHNFNFGSNNFFFRPFEFPDFHNGFDIDSMIKEYNFHDFDSIFPSLGNHRIIIKSYNNDSIEQKNTGKHEKNKPEMDVEVFGKNDREQKITYLKKIIIVDNEKALSKKGNDELAVKIFPNPADRYFNISFQLDPKSKTNIMITDINGKEMLKETINKSNGLYTHQLDMSGYAQGSYIINIKQGKKVASKQILIE